jgi:hypothetical protein
MRIVVGKQNSALNPGSHSCFRVGTQVSINSPGDKGMRGGGKVALAKIALVKIDKLEKRHLKGRFFQSSDEFFKYKDNMNFRLRPDHNGIVTILEFQYVAGTATDEQSLVQKDAEQSSGDGYQETANDGDSISKCNKPWTDIIIPETYKDAVLSGKLKSYYNWGSRNCLTQGQEAMIKAKFGAEFPSYGKVKVNKIKLFRASYVDAKYFSAAKDYDLSGLKKQIQLENKEEFITVIDFTVDGVVEQQPGEGQGQTQVQCLPAGDTFQATRLTSEDAVAIGTRFDALIHGKTCFRDGELAQIEMVSADGLKKRKLAVRVMSQMYVTEAKYSILSFELLQVISEGGAQ